MSVRQRTKKAVIYGVVILVLAIAALGGVLVLNSNNPPIVSGEIASSCGLGQVAVNETLQGTLQCMTTPFTRSSGTGGAINFQRLGDGNLYAKATVFSSPVVLNVALPPLLTSNLVMYFPLDEASGTTDHDLSGNLNSGTETFDSTGSLPIHTLQHCQFGYCRNFVITSLGFVTVANSASLQTTAFTFCTWSYHVGAGAVGSNGIVEGLGGQATQEIVWGTYTGHIVVYDHLDLNSLSSASTVSEFANHFICVTYDGTTTTIYVDGVSAASSIALTFISGASPLIIGKGSLSPFYFSGTLDDIRLYNVALTVVQIDQLYSYSQVYNTPTIQSAVEFFTQQQVNQSVSGTSVSWSAKYDANAAGTGYSVYPMGMEPASASTNAIEFNDFNGAFVAQCLKNGALTFVSLSTPTANVIHTYKIVITTAGSQVDFYIDGVDVATITTNIPTGLSSPFAELGNISAQGLYASLWAMGNVQIVNGVP